MRPELLATRPNELWSWDITKLLGPRKWTYYYLYVVLDVFSRFVVGWMVALRESAALAKLPIADTCRREAIAQGQLTLHADRGSSMASKPVALLLSDLGVTKTHSRPHVSNDNPYSESHFKTLKYRPGFPDRFGAPEDARCTRLQPGLLPLVQLRAPPQRPRPAYPGRRASRQSARTRRRAKPREAAYALHPERFVAGLPQPTPVPTAVWINKPQQPEKEPNLPAVAH